MAAGRLSNRTCTEPTRVDSRYPHHDETTGPIAKAARGKALRRKGGGSGVYDALSRELLGPPLSLPAGKPLGRRAGRVTRVQLDIAAGDGTVAVCESGFIYFGSA